MYETTDTACPSAELAHLAAAYRALERQNAALTRLVALYDHLTGLVVQGATLESLARRLARLVDCPVVVLDPLLEPLATATPPALPPESSPAEGRAELAPSPQPRRARHRAPPRGGSTPHGAPLLPWPPDDPHWQPVLATLREEQRPLRLPALDAPAGVAAWVLAPIAVGGDVLGYLAIAETPQADGAESLALLGAQHAATVFALVLTRERNNAELAQRLRADLLEALLLAPSADPAAMRARAEGLGVEPAQPYAVLVAAVAPQSPSSVRPGAEGSTGGGPPPPGARGDREAAESGTTHLVPQHVLASLASLAGQQAPGVIAVARREEVVALVPIRARGMAPRHSTDRDLDGRAPALAKRERDERDTALTQAGGYAAAFRERNSARARGKPWLAQAVGEQLIVHGARLYPTGAITVGIGGPAATPVELPRAYRQARRAFETACRFGQHGRVVTFADLGIYRLLHQVDDPAELADFAQHVLGPLLAYDRAHGAEFVRTLAVYLHHHGSLQLAARELCVHVNTVSYRLQRIQTITGLDLTEADDRLAAAIALKILESGAAPL